MLIPPKNTFFCEASGSSTLIGMYAGMSSASWPRLRSAVTSVLSRMQLPQYMPAAPAVMNAMRMARSRGVGAVAVVLRHIPDRGERLSRSGAGDRGQETGDRDQEAERRTVVFSRGAATDG